MGDPPFVAGRSPGTSRTSRAGFDCNDASWRYSVALTDYALGLCALMGTLLIPFAGLYVLLRRKRGSGTKPAPVRVRA
jgi:hypothetical protein